MSVRWNEGKGVGFEWVEELVRKVGKDEGIEEFMGEEGIGVVEIENEGMDFRVDRNKNK